MRPSSLYRFDWLFPPTYPPNYQRAGIESVGQIQSQNQQPIGGLILPGYIPEAHCIPDNIARELTNLHAKPNRREIAIEFRIERHRDAIDQDGATPPLSDVQNRLAEPAELRDDFGDADTTPPLAKELEFVLQAAWYLDIQFVMLWNFYRLLGRLFRQRAGAE